MSLRDNSWTDMVKNWSRDHPTPTTLQNYMFKLRPKGTRNGKVKVPHGHHCPNCKDRAISSVAPTCGCGERRSHHTASPPPLGPLQFLYCLTPAQTSRSTSKASFPTSLLMWFYILFFKKKYLFLIIWLHRVLVVACGIQFPDQGSNPAPLYWEHRVLATGPPGNSLVLY